MCSAGRCQAPSRYRLLWQKPYQLRLLPLAAKEANQGVSFSSSKLPQYAGGYSSLACGYFLYFWPNHIAYSVVISTSMNSSETFIDISVTSVAFETSTLLTALGVSSTN